MNTRRAVFFLKYKQGFQTLRQTNQNERRQIDRIGDEKGAFTTDTNKIEKIMQEYS